MFNLTPQRASCLGKDFERVGYMSRYTYLGQFCGSWQTWELFGRVDAENATITFGLYNTIGVVDWRRKDIKHAIT